MVNIFSYQKHLEKYLLWKKLVEAINGRKGIDKDMHVSIYTERENGEKSFVFWLIS